MPSPAITETLPTETVRRRLRLSCPRCTGSVRRKRRTALQRWLPAGVAPVRLRCVDSACGWSGSLAARLGPGASPPVPRHQRALRGMVPLLLGGLAVAAAQWGASLAPVADIEVGPRLFARGEAFDGDALPADHPLLIPVGTALASRGNDGGNDSGSDSGGARESPSPAPPAATLSLRRFCAWGRPGRMPYRGTAEEALRAARLPAAVRAQLAVAITAGMPHDRLVIANDTIRAVASGRSFDAHDFAMTYGRTLCLGTRVNFKPGHAEPASLYEAFDAQGRRHSVMVPDVCGNISVITPRGGITRVASTDPRARSERDPGVTRTAKADKPNEVPAPGTLALSLLALAGAALAGRAARRNAHGRAQRAERHSR